MVSEYGSMLLFMTYGLFMSFLLFLLSYFFIYSTSEDEKLTSYECGFDAFSEASMRFEVNFYLVGMIFMLFDVELSFLFPWVFSIYFNGFFGFLVLIFFLGLLTVGFMYEWICGALIWS